MKILFAGIIARYPFGGVTWCSLMYLLGLRALGHDVFYIEDTGECVYDPVENTRSTDPSYGTNYIHQALEPFGLGDRWSFVNYDGTYHGRDADAVKRFCAEADLFINLSGGSWFWRDEYVRIPRTVFIDSDPAFTQLAIAKAEPWYVQFFQRFSHLFTFGSNIGTAASPVPVGDFHWHKTWQPVTLEHWHTNGAPRNRFTSVMTWEIESFTDVGGNKDQEFIKYIDLPSRTAQPFELAINGPQTLLREHGWSTVPAMGTSRTLWDYRAFIQASKAEFGVAKHTYVATRSGWFSDRTECYLAAGRPALVQDTGWTAHLPHGDGLLAFSSPDEALAGIDRINADYPAHAERAAEIAREHFEAARVLQALVAKGQDVTLFATGDSTTRARLHALFPRGYWDDHDMWPWELYEMMNLAAAVERSAEFDIIHFQAAYYPMSLPFSRLSRVPVVQTLHHSPTESEVRLWAKYPEAPFVAISKEQASLLTGLNVAGIVLHGIDTDRFTFREVPDDYVLFLGRFTEGKGPLQAIEVARRLGLKLILAAAEEPYYREVIAPHVDGRQIVYFGEADFAAKVKLYGGARALLYPIQAREPFGLVLAEAMACGTPVAALDRGAVREVVDDGVTGIVFDTLDQMANGLDRVFTLDRRRVHQHAVARFGIDRMVDEYIGVYREIVDAHRATRP